MTFCLKSSPDLYKSKLSSNFDQYQNCWLILYRVLGRPSASNFLPENWWQGGPRGGMNHFISKTQPTSWKRMSDDTQPFDGIFLSIKFRQIDPKAPLRSVFYHHDFTCTYYFYTVFYYNLFVPGYDCFYVLVFKSRNKLMRFMIHPLNSSSEIRQQSHYHKLVAAAFWGVDWAGGYSLIIPAKTDRLPVFTQILVGEHLGGKNFVRNADVFFATDTKLCLSFSFLALHMHT